MLDSMFEVPGSDVSAVCINEDTVLGHCPPVYQYNTQDQEEEEEARHALKAGASSGNS